MFTPKFAHNVFQTANHEAMRDWHGTVLDAHVVYEDATLTFLTFDDEHRRVALLHPPIEFTPKTAVTASLHHSAYTFDGIDALLERYATLRAADSVGLAFDPHELLAARRAGGQRRGTVGPGLGAEGRPAQPAPSADGRLSQRIWLTVNA
jgi:hypothetical protein